MSSNRTLCLGGGVTGLSAAIAGNLTIIETLEISGGICTSYTMTPDNEFRSAVALVEDNSYLFEVGGGHWIFGGDPTVLRFIQLLTPTKSYTRRSSVFFSDQGLYVPYPLQNHLSYLDRGVVKRTLIEMAGRRGGCTNMKDWLTLNFGATLCELFFHPFHELYTAGLYDRIAPQDAYKSPVDMALVIRGAFERTPPIGYNATFIYPTEGLNTLVQRMAEKCDVRYSHRVVGIDIHSKELTFADGTTAYFDQLISTLPLNKVMEMTGLVVDVEPDPYTSVLVLNIGAVRGSACPKDHWIYVPTSASGFHRVGFYSNVDPLFLPASVRENNDRVSIYVERAFVGGNAPIETEIASYSRQVVAELQAWGFIENVEVLDPTWIDVAYTWSWPGSRWREEALRLLEKHSIYQVGRYGRWMFQGIADSIRDGFIAGASFKG